MPPKVRYVVDQQAVDRLLKGPNGGVARDLLRRGTRVQTRAKQLVRVDTGRLRASITVLLTTYGGDLTVRIGTNVKYARFVHDGTGLYGPKHQLIRPRSGKVMVFNVRGGSKPVFTMTSRGQRPNEFLREALPAGVN